uniref:uncharacterized protein LOC131101724 isoform X2 n=1 Tax=Doryrhamphus excisus TaxID=161450 RepID=UPI0025AE4507|nr:uncharacterized protein LOC131101724 isoform X2 [Doryrhamphus excisus]
MATSEKKRSSYFSPLELDILMRSYGKFESVFKKKSNIESVFKKKSNTAAAAKERESAWEKITARVNACNPTGEKRTWKQLKMKYKNIVQTANRKRASARKTGGGPPPPRLTEAEELAMSQTVGRPVAEGIPGGTSSSDMITQEPPALIRYSEGVLGLVDPCATLTDDEDDGTTMSAAFSMVSEREPERPTESMAGQQEEGPSTSTAQIDTVRYVFSKFQRLIQWNSCATV